jgi:replicative DNA helicase
MVKEGTIPYRRIGTGGKNPRIFFTPEDLDAYLEAAAVPMRKPAREDHENHEEHEDLERAVLSCYLHGADIGNGMEPKYFSNPVHQVIFAGIDGCRRCRSHLESDKERFHKDLFDTFKMVLLTEEVDSIGGIDRNGFFDYLDKVLMTVPTSANIDYYEKALSERSQR